MFNAIKSLNLLVRFGLEMCLLAAIAVACWRTITNDTIRLVATITLPIIVMTVWATIVHGSGVPFFVQIGTQITLFAIAYIALCLVRRYDLAAMFASAVAINAVLMVAWGQ